MMVRKFVQILASGSVVALLVAVLPTGGLAQGLGGPSCPLTACYSTNLTVVNAGAAYYTGTAPNQTWNEDSTVQFDCTNGSTGCNVTTATGGYYSTDGWVTQTKLTTAFSTSPNATCGSLGNTYSSTGSVGPLTKGVSYNLIRVATEGDPNGDAITIYSQLFTY
jgi:hypothetical protein